MSEALKIWNEINNRVDLSYYVGKKKIAIIEKALQPVRSAAKAQKPKVEK